MYGLLIWQVANNGWEDSLKVGYGSLLELMSPRPARSPSYHLRRIRLIPSSSPSPFLIPSSGLWHKNICPP